mgnify:CR=1 FL=1
MYYDLLECAADYISDMPLDKAQTEEMLREKFHRHTEKFDSLKIISEDGRCVQDGQAYSLKEYFLMAMLGNRGSGRKWIFLRRWSDIVSTCQKMRHSRLRECSVGRFRAAVWTYMERQTVEKDMQGFLVIDNHGKYIVSDGGNDTLIMIS